MLQVAGAAPRRHLLPGLWEEDAQAWAFGAGGPAIAACSEATGALLDAYDQNDPSSGYSSGAYDLLGQSIAAAGIGSLTGVCLSMNRQGSPTGTLKVQIKAHAGTFGVSSVPTGSALAESIDFDIAAVSTNTSTFARYWLPLTSALSLTLPYYTVEIDFSGIISDGSNYINVWAKTAGTRAGNVFYDTGAGYAAAAGRDLYLRLYGTPSVPVRSGNVGLSLRLGLGL